MKFKNKPLTRDQIVTVCKEQLDVCYSLKGCYESLIKKRTRDQYMNEGRLEFIEALLRIAEGQEEEILNDS